MDRSTRSCGRGERSGKHRPYAVKLMDGYRREDCRAVAPRAGEADRILAFQSTICFVQDGFAVLRW